MEQIVLVDRQDNAIGTMEKMEAHEKGLLHRAFSVFVFNLKGEMLIHRRAEGKYHSGGLWTNACCSHPRPNELTEEAAHRRLMEEMGFDCPLQSQFTFIYKSALDHGLTEHELDHVFTGEFSGTPHPNPDEVSDWKFMSTEAISEALREQPDQFTVWFKIAFAALIERNIKIQA